MELKLGSARARDDQNRWVAIGVGIAGIVAFFAGCTVPSAIIRATPEDWLWPEKRAANILSRDMWGAGVRLLQVADPRRWSELARASRIRSENDEAIAACERKALHRKKPVPCNIEIKPVDP